MKKIICILISILLVFSGCAPVNEEKPKTEYERISAIWIFYSELSMLGEKNKDKKAFTAKVERMLDNCVGWGINTVFLQVRPFSDSFYKSDIFPWSYYLTGRQGKAVDYDPLEICIELAHERGLSLHAWINPFRISFDKNTENLADNHPAIGWIKNKTADVVILDSGIYYSPASMKAQKLVLDGVREIVRDYDVDGIHIDDYFYPSTQRSVDEAFYKQYTDEGGRLSLDEWRLSTVSAFVSQMYTTVKSEKSDCIFSISPAGNVTNNYEQQYADVRLWCSRRGYADWIIPQLYYGFENESLTFDKALSEWEKLNTIGAVRMIYGIAAYKVNESDDEWKAGNGIIDKQLDLLRKTDGCHGAAFFSYASLADKSRQPEFKNISSFSAVPSE
ncbi:MAG: family 10 glycosylhydrolase [Clostridia bacterium]|nr:family 10 glycosylhydrolase [Clostridia bacterium]